MLKKICTYDSWQIVKHVDKYYVINKKAILPVEMVVKLPINNKTKIGGDCDYFGETDDGKFRVGFKIIHPKELSLQVEGGSLKASLFEDIEYPGINVEFIPKDSDMGPRILMEKPRNEKLRAFIWKNEDDEAEEVKI